MLTDAVKGTLNHFRKDKKPSDAGSRCLDCKIESDCPYSAKKIYLDAIERGHKDWPVSVIVDDSPTVENVRAALQSGPYGRCVYECDNDVSKSICSFIFVNRPNA